MSPVPLSLLWTCRGSYPLEGALHSHFAGYRSHGEWFTFPPSRDPAGMVEVAVTLLGYDDDGAAGWRRMPRHQSVASLDGWLHGTLLRSFESRYFTWEDAASAVGAPVRFVREYGERLVEQGLVLAHRRQPGLYGTRWVPEDWGLPGVI
jgi:hypothetical protein